MAKTNKPSPTAANRQTPKPQTKRQAGKQEKHLHQERMQELKNQRSASQTREAGRTQRTATRSAALVSAVSEGTRNAADVASKQIELQQLISGNRFSNNDATDENRTSSGATNGSGNSITQNPGAGGDVLR